MYNRYNEMGPLRFLFISAFLSFAYSQAYLLLPFRSVFACDAEVSRILFHFFILAIDSACFALSVKANRNYKTILANALLPLVLWFCLSFWSTYDAIRYSVIATLILCFGYSIIYWVQFFRQRMAFLCKHSISRYIHCWLICYKNLVMHCLTIPFLICVVSIHISGSIICIPSGDLPRNPHLMTITSCREQLSNAIESYSNLSLIDRLELARTIMLIECNQLGIPYHDLSTNVLADGTLAYNTVGEQAITISIDFLESCDNPNQLISVIAHECFHGAQYYAANEETTYNGLKSIVFTSAQIKQYQHEFRFYISGDEDFLAYYNQRLEIDARAHAESRLAIYAAILFPDSESTD